MYRLICTYIGSEVSSHLKTVIFYLIYTCTLAYTHAQCTGNVSSSSKILCESSKIFIVLFIQYLLSTCMCHESESHQAIYCAQRGIKAFTQINSIDCQRWLVEVREESQAWRREQSSMDVGAREKQRGEIVKAKKRR